MIKSTQEKKTNVKSVVPVFNVFNNTIDLNKDFVYEKEFMDRIEFEMTKDKRRFRASLGCYLDKVKRSRISKFLKKFDGNFRSITVYLEERYRFNSLDFEFLVKVPLLIVNLNWVTRDINFMKIIASNKSIEELRVAYNDGTNRSKRSIYVKRDSYSLNRKLTMFFGMIGFASKYGFLNESNLNNLQPIEVRTLVEDRVTKDAFTKCSLTKLYTKQSKSKTFCLLDNNEKIKLDIFCTFIWQIFRNKAST